MTIHYLNPKGGPMFRPLSLATVLTLLALLAIPTVQAGDDTRDRWWRSADIARQVQLTDAEVQQLDIAFDAAELRMIELRSNVAVERAKLRALLEQPVLDEDAITRQHQRQQEARARLSAERLALLVEVRRIIGQDLFIKLMEIRDAQRRHRHWENDESARSQQ